jgi:hypothetical protein
MKNLAAFLLVVVTSCNAPFFPGAFSPGNSKTVIDLRKKSAVRNLVQPSQIFIDYFYTYKTKTGEWPADFISMSKIKEYKTAYDDLFINGMYDLSFERMTKDSLVLNFTFSKSKYAQSKGYDNTYYPDLVKGKYIFYRADSVKMFTVKL